MWCTWFAKIAPRPFERMCWRQFTAQWGDCKKSRTTPLSAIIIITSNTFYRTQPPHTDLILNELAGVFQVHVLAARRVVDGGQSQTAQSVSACNSLGWSALLHTMFYTTLKTTVAFQAATHTSRLKIMSRHWHQLRKNVKRDKNLHVPLYTFHLQWGKNWKSRKSCSIMRQELKV